MKVVNVRAHKDIFFYGGRVDSPQEMEACLHRNMFNSAPKNIGRELVHRRLVSSFEEWRFWGLPSKQFSFHGVPLRMIHTPDVQGLEEAERIAAAEGEPDMLWAEGIHFPLTLGRLFELFPGSLKIIYPKYSEPWLIEGIERYDVCLVDELWQIEEMKNRCPGVDCRVWDKLVDYERDFFPMSLPKQYDICYVARLHPRKYHKLLFQSLAKLQRHRLKVILIGSNENDCQKYLEPMAREAGVEVIFTGHVGTEKVNRLINESRVGVLCDHYDAVPRAMLEYMAADVPVVANSEMRAGTRYIGPKAGLVRSPQKFHEGIAEILDDPARFRPREHLLENYSRPQVIEKIWNIVKSVANKEKYDAESQGAPGRY